MNEISAFIITISIVLIVCGGLIYGTSKLLDYNKQIDFEDSKIICYHDYDENPSHWCIDKNSQEIICKYSIDNSRDDVPHHSCLQ